MDSLRSKLFVWRHCEERSDARPDERPFGRVAISLDSEQTK